MQILAHTHVHSLFIHHLPKPSAENCALEDAPGFLGYCRESISLGEILFSGHDALCVGSKANIQKSAQWGVLADQQDERRRCCAAQLVCIAVNVKVVFQW